MWHLRGKLKQFATTGLVFLASISLAVPTAPPVNAADHAEATSLQFGSNLWWNRRCNRRSLNVRTSSLFAFPTRSDGSAPMVQ
jgi:hypothetical protein